MCLFLNASIHMHGLQTSYFNDQEKREFFFLNIILQQKCTPMSHDRKKKMVDSDN